MAKKSKIRKKISAKYYKCNQCRGYILLAKKKSHHCVIPTEEAIFENLEDEPREAWSKLKKFAENLGPQKIYCSAKAVMFSRDVCYMFVRSKKNKIELCLMLDEKIIHDSIKKIEEYSKTRFRHTLHIHHEDSIEVPLTDWILKAWNMAFKP
jgi:hypothetical protein